MSPFELYSIAGSAMLFALMPAFALPFLYIYLVHDYAGRRTGQRDPLLGSKIFTTMMMSAGGQLVLGGLAMASISAVGDGDAEFGVKTGMGMVLAGVLVGALPTALYFTRIHTSGGARVAHQALGLNALLCGMVFMGGVIGLSQEIVHSGNDKAEPALLVLIYGTAMAIMAFRLVQSPIAPARVVDHE